MLTRVHHGAPALLSTSWLAMDRVAHRCARLRVCSVDTRPRPQDTLRFPEQVGGRHGHRSTTEDTCADGACRGIGVVCDDRSICTRDACVPATGCQAFPDPDVCEDHDPCTANLCDPLTGCDHAPAPDGTPCAPQDRC